MLSLLEVATVYSYSKKEWCAHLALIYQALSSCFICGTAKHEDKVRELVEQTGTLMWCSWCLEDGMVSQPADWASAGQGVRSPFVYYQSLCGL